MAFRQRRAGLYALTVDLPSDVVTKQIGLRTVELITTPDAAGSRFAFKVNGREIFCRGANWIRRMRCFRCRRRRRRRTCCSRQKLRT
ncbi:hypothetical protein AJ87_30050 [Rhizobium yanglingense]|nr:hypothetical protein AJ87_30050 [Rhizobium yanglingense]